MLKTISSRGEASCQNRDGRYRPRSAVAHLSGDLRFVCVSDEFVSWLGVVEKDLAGNNLSHHLGEHFYSRMKPHFEACLNGQTALFRHLVSTAQGRRWTEFTLRPCFDQTGKNEGIYLIAKDVHEGW
jgi:PAS domain S-box-containing protein